MISVIQRALEASVTVEGRVVGRIKQGIVALVAVTKQDTDADVKWMANKLVGMRIFRGDTYGKHFELDVRQVGGAILLVSQFTLAADTRRGRRPGFDPAAPPETARKLFEQLVHSVGAAGIPVATGEFAADMQVTLTNDGPATFILDSSDSAARLG